MPAASPHAWFSGWVDQHLALTLTLAQELDPAGMLAAFGPAGFDQGECSFDEADDLGVDVVRLGVVAGWTYAVEHFTTRGSDPELLEPLSAAGRLAVGVSFTQTVSGLMLAREGVLITGFDVDLPNFRYGIDEHAYDQEMRQSGFMDDGQDRPGARVARFIELTTGFVVTREMLEAPLPCATLG